MTFNVNTTWTGTNFDLDLDFDLDPDPDPDPDSDLHLDTVHSGPGHSPDLILVESRQWHGLRLGYMVLSLQQQSVVFSKQVILYHNVPSVLVPSVLWRCWLDGRKGIRPVKKWAVGCWCGYLSGARCRLAYGPADASATHCLAAVKSRLVLPFWYRLTRIVPEKGPLNACVCIIMFTDSSYCLWKFSHNNYCQWITWPKLSYQWLVNWQ